MSLSSTASNMNPRPEAGRGEECANNHTHKPIEQEEVKPLTEELPKNIFSKLVHMARNYAGVVDSRESVTRIALDLFAFDIPTVVAAATRNWASFFEALFEATVGTTTLLIAPTVTKLLAKITSGLFLESEDQKHYDKLIRFYRSELHDEHGFQSGLQRILAEEPQDLERIAKVYDSSGNNTKSADFKSKADDLKNYFQKLRYHPGKLKSLIKFKEAVITAESCFEGFFWGSFGLTLRWLRKNILKQDRFTGTKKYLNEKDASKLGEDLPLNKLQKTFGVMAMFMAPVYNTIIMKLCRNRDLVARNKFLQICDRGLEMTHGLFPRLGLLFSYTTVPKWFGNLCTVQGMDEFVERALKLVTILPSWWLGHRVTNGGLSAYFDKKLAARHNVPEGILVEPKDIGKRSPEPARIHHVLERTAGNPKLQKEAKDLHAGILYSGIKLHSIGVFLITLLINQITKWRVTSKAKNL